MTELQALRAQLAAAKGEVSRQALLLHTAQSGAADPLCLSDDEGGTGLGPRLVSCCAAGCARTWVPSKGKPVYRCNAPGCTNTTHPSCLRSDLKDAAIAGPCVTGVERQFNCPDHMLGPDADDDEGYPWGSPRSLFRSGRFPTCRTPPPPQPGAGLRLSPRPLCPPPWQRRRARPSGPTPRRRGQHLPLLRRPHPRVSPLPGLCIWSPK